MSLAHAPDRAAVDLREIAGQAWQRLQDEVAARKRQEIARRRQDLMDDARRALFNAFGPPGNDEFRQIDWATCTVELTILSTDDLVMAQSTGVVVAVVFMGETFEYRSDQGDPHALFHVWTCPTCGELWEPPTKSNRIDSLSDLGAWLAYAPTVHTCAEVAP